MNFVDLDNYKCIYNDTIRCSNETACSFCNYNPFKTVQITEQKPHQISIEEFINDNSKI